MSELVSLPDHTQYAYRVWWSPEDGEFVGLCAEFPLLSWLASSQEEALCGVRDLVRDVVGDLVRDGEVVPAVAVR
ncbi:antitoxin HicB [Nocardia takedensis]